MTTVFPAQIEQYLLELTNRMRLEPAGELQRILGSKNREITEALEYFKTNEAVLQQQWMVLKPAPPLAWSGALHDSAQAHNQRMILTDTQSHFLPNEPGLLDRMRLTGYEPASVAENIFAYPESIEAAHASFALDWGAGPNGIQEPAGHRLSMMSDLYREVGMDIREERNPQTSVGTYVVTQHFGIDSQAAWGLSEAYLLGVVYRDTVQADRFYTPGEGLGDVTVTVTEVAGDRRVETTTWAAGGYQLQLPQGHYRVEFQLDIDGDGTLEMIAREVSLGHENLKLDVVTGVATDAAMTNMTADNLTLVNGAAAIASPAVSIAPNSAVDDVFQLSLTMPSGIVPQDLTASDRGDASDAPEVILGRAIGDTVQGAGGDDYIAGFGGNDALFGNRGNDSLAGGAGDDTLFGGRGDDAIVGEDGNDIVMADNGDDILTGGAGDDELWGGAGRDQLAGQRGDDTLTGGGGDDVFVLGTHHGVDVVTDFEHGVDRIGLQGMAFEQLTLTPQADGVMIVGVGASASMTLLGVAAEHIDASDFLLLG